MSYSTHTNQHGDVNVNVRGPNFHVQGIFSKRDFGITLDQYAQPYINVLGNVVNGNLNTSLLLTILGKGTVIQGSVIATGNNGNPQYLMVGNTVDVAGKYIGFEEVAFFEE